MATTRVRSWRRVGGKASKITVSPMPDITETLQQARHGAYVGA